MPVRAARNAPQETNLTELPAYARVGRLAVLGLTEPWQVALLVPNSYDDLRTPAPSASQLEGKGILWLRPEGALSTSGSGGAPRTRVSVRDAAGAVYQATAFGETAAWAKLLRPGEPGWYLCDTQVWQGTLQLRLHGAVPDAWIGRMRPRYPGKPSVMPAERVRDVVHRWLPRAIPIAASWLRQRTEPFADEAALLHAAGLPGWSLEQCLEQVHLPTSPKFGQLACEALRRIAGFLALAKIHAHILERPAARAFELHTWQARAKALPFELVPEQVEAIRTMVAEMAKPIAMRALVLGDVGSGKTPTFTTVVAALLDAGGRAAILLPTLPLAEQVHREILAAWPDLDPLLVTASTDKTSLETQRLLVGTTALLHADTGALDLVVVDEEQKFSVDQREQLAGAAGHLITASATCIPRSQALARYGALTVCTLRKGHTKKNIQSTLWTAADKRALFTNLKRAMERGEQLLVIYPKRVPGEQSAPAAKKSGRDGKGGAKAASKPGKKQSRESVESARAAWEPLCPGRVRTLTGDSLDEEKSSVIADMREGRAQILLATTVVEVGLTLPDLRRMLVVAPDRYGLTTLHQLRGRLARLGGDGWFELYAAEPLSAKAQSRLEAFLRCRDGFEVAELDLHLRGFGDLAPGSSRQSGADHDVIFGTAPGAEDVGAMEALWQRVAERTVAEKR